MSRPAEPARRRNAARRPLTPGVVVVLLLVAALGYVFRPSGTVPSPAGVGARPSEAGPDRHGCAAIIDGLIAARRSDVVVECSGEIVKVLDDDLEGAAHQRFLVRTMSGTVVKVSHNIDLAPRVPAVKGDLLEFKGEFEWNELGGVVHWTHHDPGGRREGGWVRSRGRLYE